MRTTLTIDDDVLAAARALAERQDKTIGAVVSELARKALRAPTEIKRRQNGIPLLPVTNSDAVITMELVNELRDESP